MYKKVNYMLWWPNLDSFIKLFATKQRINDNLKGRGERNKNKK